MRCVILQPSYLPWRGYFHQIQRCDLFVFYDDVPFDARGWRNRNRVKTGDGPRWLTVPVRRKGTQPRRTPLNEIEIDSTTDWGRRHVETLRHAYARAPFYERYIGPLAPLLERPPELLVELTIRTTVELAGELGIGPQRFVRASAIRRREAAKTADLLSILSRVGATRYLSGPSAKAYLDEGLLERHGIAIDYMRYDYPEYPQLHPPYDPQVSIVDLLFMVGPEAPRYIWGSP
jgi:hypothetical protein